MPIIIGFGWYVRIIFKADTANCEFNYYITRTNLEVCL